MGLFRHKITQQEFEASGYRFDNLKTECSFIGLGGKKATLDDIPLSWRNCAPADAKPGYIYTLTGSGVCSATYVRALQADTDCPKGTVPRPDFMSGPIQSLDCPTGYSKVRTLDHCGQAARSLGYATDATEQDDSQHPTGCYGVRDQKGNVQVRFNKTSNGTKDPHSFPICAREAAECAKVGERCMTNSFRSYTWQENGDCTGRCVTTSRCIQGHRCCFSRCTPAHELNPNGSCAVPAGVKKATAAGRAFQSLLNIL